MIATWPDPATDRPGDGADFALFKRPLNRDPVHIAQIFKASVEEIALGTAVGHCTVCEQANNLKQISIPLALTYAAAGQTMAVAVGIRAQYKTAIFHRFLDQKWNKPLWRGSIRWAPNSLCHT